MHPITKYILILFAINVSTANLNGSHYKAAVVEYHPFISNDTIEVTQKNLDAYLKFIEKASKESVDILAFPEATLNRNVFKEGENEAAIKVPSEKDNVIPCDDKTDKYSLVLKSISCGAKHNKMYIVINVAEYVECEKSITECKNNDMNRLQFNTNVVFNRQGKIVSRYRKIHLFKEKYYTPSLDKALGIFETDFGVRFGHMVCFDFLYQEPTLQLLERERIQNVIFSTMWFSQLPSFSALEIHQAYAYKYNVNLLTANVNNPPYGNSGSGIYSGKRGIIKSIITGDKTSTMLIAELPKVPDDQAYIPDKMKSNSHAEKLDNFITNSNDMSLYKSVLIDENKDHQTHELSDGNVQCKFDIKINKKFSSDKNGTKHYTYRAVLLNGVILFGEVTGGIIECQIIACTGDDIHSCARRFDRYSDLKPLFEISKISIEATVPKPKYNSSLGCNNLLYVPVSALTNLEPLESNEFKFQVLDEVKKSNKINIHLSMTAPQSELITFGLLGRVFDRDFSPLTVAPKSRVDL